MVSWVIENMGGEIPKTNDRLIPPNNAAAALNTDLAGGMLQGLPQPRFVISGESFTPPSSGFQRAYRVPNPNPGGSAPNEVWIPFQSPYASAVPSPLANDDTGRIYWTVPGEGAFYSTFADILAGTAPYNLGFVAPDTNPAFAPTVVASGGTASTSVPYVERSYCYTFTDADNFESSPSYPSTVVAGASDGTWTISNLPTSVPSSPAGKNYPAPTVLKLYRTVTGQGTGATFYLIGVFALGVAPAGGTYVDPLPDYLAALSPALVTANYNNPPDGLDGLTSLPGGMLVGFTGNTVHFCEPNLPHTWPAEYDESFRYNIVGFGVWQQNLVVLTDGYPQSGSGNSPSNFVFSQVQVPEPCISRGSIITDLLGVYYASPNGLVMLSYYGMMNQSQSLMTRNIWEGEFKAANIIACRHRAQYLAMTSSADGVDDGTGSGFIIDYSDARTGVVQVGTFTGATAIWNDVYTGTAYIAANDAIYEWDSPVTPPMTYRWASRLFSLPAPCSLGACQMTLDTSVLVPYVPQPPLVGVVYLESPDPTLVLPAGVNCVFNLYADGVLVYTQHIVEVRPVFRLPSGFLAFEWQVEIIARCPVYRIELASTMRELKKV